MRSGKEGRREGGAETAGRPLRVGEGLQSESETARVGGRVEWEETGKCKSTWFGFVAVRQGEGEETRVVCVRV